MLENGLFIIDKFRNLNLEVHNFSMFKKMHTFATELEASRLLTHSQKTSKTERSHVWLLSNFNHSILSFIIRKEAFLYSLRLYFSPRQSQQLHGVRIDL